MAHSFRPYQPDQAYLLPVAPRDWLPEGHLALFLLDVLEQVDLGPILQQYKRSRGPRAYHPRLLLAVLLYGYCSGVFSSRKLAARCESDLGFRVVAGGAQPDFRTLSEFRRRHLSEMQHLFREVLRVCREAGLLKLGHLSLDGSKYQANASKHKAMSYERAVEAEGQLDAEIKRLLEQAEAVDREEDTVYGPEQRGDELPEELQRRESRLAKIRAAKARLEERARERAKSQAEAQGLPAEKVAERVAKAQPGAKEQSNFTDPESRIMKSKAGWIQGYNAQLMVNEQGVIVAEAVSNQSNDSPQLGAMLTATEASLEAAGVTMALCRPAVFSADAGYCSEANLALLQERGIDAYVATGRERHGRGGIDPQGRPRAPLRTAMRAKLQTEAGRAVYARRKCITEPVHGLIKRVQGFRQFLLRGVDKVRPEFTLVATAYNVLKLWWATPHPGGA